MKLAEIHKSTPLELTLAKNGAIKSMLMPLTGRSYYWKNFNTTKSQPPPPDTQGPVSGGHYDALIKGDPRKEKYFGGPSLGPI